MGTISEMRGRGAGLEAPVGTELAAVKDLFGIQRVTDVVSNQGNVPGRVQWRRGASGGEGLIESLTQADHQKQFLGTYHQHLDQSEELGVVRRRIRNQASIIIQISRRNNRVREKILVGMVRRKRPGQTLREIWNKSQLGQGSLVDVKQGMGVVRVSGAEVSKGERKELRTEKRAQMHGGQAVRNPRWGLGSSRQRGDSTRGGG
jgi:hypothetical protein